MLNLEAKLQLIFLWSLFFLSLLVLLFVVFLILLLVLRMWNIKAAVPCELCGGNRRLIQREAKKCEKDGEQESQQRPNMQENAPSLCLCLSCPFPCPSPCPAQGQATLRQGAPVTGQANSTK